MKLLFKILFMVSLSFANPVFALAHQTGETHVEQPASIDPVVAVIVVVAIAVLGFLLWKFVLKSKETSPK